MIVKLILGVNGYTSSDGSAPLYVRVSTGEKKKYYPIGVKLQKNEWDSNNQIITKSHSKAVDYNPKLFNIIGAVKAGLYSDINHNVQHTVDTLFYGYQPASLITPSPPLAGANFVAPYYQDYKNKCELGEIKKKRGSGKMPAGTISIIDTNLKRFIAYEKHAKTKFTFDDLNDKWLDSFIEFLRHTFGNNNNAVGLSENSIVSTVLCIKKMLRQAAKDKLNTNEAFRDFNPPQRHETDNITLTKDEVNRILALDLSDTPHLKNEQERFALAYNFVLRFSDSLKIDPKFIYFEAGQPMFRFTTHKTNVKITIPITPESYALLQRENFTIKAKSLSNTNKRLQKLGELAKIDTPVTLTEFRGEEWVETTYKRYELMTSHITRRSAATHLYQETRDLNLVRIVGGWKSLQMLQKYLKTEEIDNIEKMVKLKHFTAIQPAKL